MAQQQILPAAFLGIVDKNARYQPHGGQGIMSMYEQSYTDNLRAEIYNIGQITGLAKTIIRGNNPLDDYVGATIDIKSVDIGLIQEETILRRSDELNIGTNSTINMDAAQKNRIKIAYQLVKAMFARINFTAELLAWQSIIQGKQELIIGSSNPQDTIDYGRNANNTITISDKWNTSAGNPFNDIGVAVEIINKNSNLDADVIIMNGKTYNAFINNETVQKQANLLRLNTVTINMADMQLNNKESFQQMGMTPIGYLNVLGKNLEILIYDKSYTDSTGSKSYIADGEIVVMQKNIQQRAVFGATDVFPDEEAENLYSEMFGIEPDMVNLEINEQSIINQQQFHFDVRRDTGGKGLILRMQKSVLFFPTIIDGIAVLKGAI